MLKPLEGNRHWNHYKMVVFHQWIHTDVSLSLISRNWSTAVRYVQYVYLIGMEITEMLICRHSLKQLDLRLVPLSRNHYKSQKGLAREGIERYLDALYIQET